VIQRVACWRALVKSCMTAIVAYRWFSVLGLNARLRASYAISRSAQIAKTWAFRPDKAMK
jgi:hypothetical protein